MKKHNADAQQAYHMVPSPRYSRWLNFP